VQQVWGLGVPFWQLPFDVLSRVYGFSKFPDRIALGIFIALVAFIVCRTWFSALARRETEKECHPPITAASGAVILFLFFAPLTYLLRSPLDHYGEPLVYVYYFGVLLACGVIALARNPKWGRFWLLCALAGLGGLIRPTLVFYGFATIVMAGFVMVCHEQRQLRHGTKLAYFFKFIWNPRLLLGLLLFVSGGGLLFITNYLRFGSGWEFGHSLNVQGGNLLPSVYSTHFDYPFSRVPLTESARELLGALFRVNYFNNLDWYAPGIFAGQSSTFRWREFSFRTYDISYAVCIGLAWVIGTWTTRKWLRSLNSHEMKPCRFQLPSPYILIIIWSVLATLPLIVLYMKVPVIASRYMLDFAPAFAAALVGLWCWMMEQLLKREQHPKRIAWFLFFALVAWQGSEIVLVQSANWPPQSFTRQDLREQVSSRPPSSKPLPNEYKAGDSMELWGIPYNGEGWNSTNGQIWSCAIFFVESPKFLELELAAAPDSHVTEASLTTIQAKVGLEFLKRSSITRTNDTWIVHFYGPRQHRYQRGLQPVFLAMVPPEELAKYVIPPSPWILKSLHWKVFQRTR